jgi:hypothetical protein
VGPRAEQCQNVWASAQTCTLALGRSRQLRAVSKRLVIVWRLFLQIVTLTADRKPPTKASGDEPRNSRQFGQRISGPSPTDLALGEGRWVNLDQRRGHAQSPRSVSREADIRKLFADDRWHSPRQTRAVRQRSLDPSASTGHAIGPDPPRFRETVIRDRTHVARATNLERAERWWS